jgi:hypothetical protein
MPGAALPGAKPCPEALEALLRFERGELARGVEIGGVKYLIRFRAGPKIQSDKIIMNRALFHQTYLI